MKILNTLLVLCLMTLLSSCTKSQENIKSSSTGEVLTNITARGTGGGSPFDGKVDQKSDLEDLVETAWGNGRLGLHRGHGPIEEVLEVFLGITHDEMHVLMDSGLNLAGVCETLGLDSENLIETLTASFVPFIQEGVDNKVITSEEATIWTERVRTEFRRRVHWKG